MPGFNGYISPNITYALGNPSAVSGKNLIVGMQTYFTNPSYSETTDLSSSEVKDLKVPYVIEEQGILKSAVDGNVSTAASTLVSMQVESCALGAQGSIFWSYDTDLTAPPAAQADQGRFYSFKYYSGLIEKDLSPASRPNMCGN